ncbi:hypothetical protein OSTOST_11779 [Ostertagia ostertagi]
MKALNTKKDLKRHSVGGYAFNMDSPEDRAATKIQAEIRGFLARKHVEKMKKEIRKQQLKSKPISAVQPGFFTRKHLDEQGLLSPTRSRSPLQTPDPEENHH